MAVRGGIRQSVGVPGCKPPTLLPGNDASAVWRINSARGGRLARGAGILRLFINVLLLTVSAR